MYIDIIAYIYILFRFFSLIGYYKILSVVEPYWLSILHIAVCIFFFFCLFAISWAAPAAHGGSQARGRIRATATRLQPTPQLTATPDR